MAARKKKAARKKAARTGRARRLAQLEHELPPTLREYMKQVRRLLSQLEERVEEARVDVRRRAARLLREASHRLGALEARGDASWRELTAPYRRELVRLLRRLEQGVAPPARSRPTRKKGPRKTAVRKQEAATAASSRIRESAGEGPAQPGSPGS